ncbi:TetR/AcrR family transcriptional regulator [Actinoplanes sp. N902-109]|uniref:TetR/AcrR family transcriptional regulator n=1 Tax=Actinoplanes sp. (strain N902-109) TaxID=649831 RepID=UPI000329511D|nr:TetR/AcrR family transcriptional regulator [Actinoplanes sp. N902-109]AGL21455.1 transcriptional regulator, TetR family [Actinoplanes sp. N902-109]
MPAPRPSTGRARNEQARRDVLQAALDLTGQGVEAVTVDAIAARAGVGKQTIYRWWPSKWLLVFDALLTHADRGVTTPADGSRRDRLLFFTTSTFELLNEVGPALKGLMGQAQVNPAFATEWRDRFVQPRRQALLDVLGSTNADAQAAVDLIFGGMWYRLLVGHGPLDDAYARRLVTAALALI